MVKTDDIVSVAQVGNRYYVNLWTAEGDPITVGSATSASSAAVTAAAIADAVRGWIEAGR